MHAAIFCFSLVLCVARIHSVTISTPVMQRKLVGESCKFRWSVIGNMTYYSIKLFSTGSFTTLGSNTNHSFDSSKSMITLVIWNIQTSNAGYYSLSINTGPSPEVNSSVLLFVYDNPTASVIQTVGRNPSFDGDRIKLNCTAYSNSLPVGDRPKMYYFWYISWIGYLRNISSGPAVLKNGDVAPGYNIEDEGKNLVIASAVSTDYWISCSVQEEGSPYRFENSINLQIYGKPCAYGLNPASRKWNAALYSYVNLYVSYQANPPVISRTNWIFVNASGSSPKYSLGYTDFTSYSVSLQFQLSSVNSYGNYSITLTNSNGSTTETFQVLPPGPPDTPSNFSVQYVTHSLVSLQWRCMWFNGAPQTFSVRLMDVATNLEVETKNIYLNADYYNSRYSTLFQQNIQPERSYAASIWSTNSYGSSNVVSLALRTPKRSLIFSVNPANISIVETEATINFIILGSTTNLIRLNVTCCVEVTTECNNKSYILADTDNQILYDILPTGTEYVFDFNVFNTDGYTYEYNLAIVKGVRVSTVPVPTTVVTNPPTCIPCNTTTLPCDITTLPYAFNETTSHDNGNPLFVPDSNQLQSIGKENLIIAVIVLAVLLGVVVLVLLGCCIGLLVWKCRQNKSQKLPATARTSVPTRNNPAIRESSEFPDAYDNYEPVVDVDRSKNSVYYKALGGTYGNAKQFSEAWNTEQSSDSGKEDIYKQNPYMNPDEIFYTKPSGTLDRPKRNRYQ